MPMKCTLECFYLLSKHHRVSAEYIDMLFSFGEPVQELVHFHQPRCHLEIGPPLSGADRPWQALVFEASGYEMRNSYKLSAMESASGDTTGESWSMRQMAVYHSFDLDSGRTFTMTAKANNNQICERIKSIGEGAVPRTLPGRFVASMETQLLGFGWCVEGWESYISTLERKIRQTSRKLSGIPIHSGDKTLLRSLTNSRKLQRNFLSSAQQWFRSAFCSKDTTDDTDIPMLSMSRAPKLEEESTIEKIKKAAARQVEALSEFPFDGLQKMHTASTKLHEAKLVMELNCRVLKDVREHYQAMFSSEELPQEIKSSCGRAHRSFQQSIKHWEKMLMMECSRAETLTHVASDGNGLVSGKSACSDSRPPFADVYLSLVWFHPPAPGRTDKPITGHGRPKRDLAHGADDVVDACHHILRPRLPPRHVSGRKTLLPAAGA